MDLVLFEYAEGIRNHERKSRASDLYVQTFLKILAISLDGFVTQISQEYACSRFKSVLMEG